jgi:hypothetical protein
MSPWEVIGWAIAIPMAFFALLFIVAVFVSGARALKKAALRPPDNVTRLHRDN